MFEGYAFLVFVVSSKVNASEIFFHSPQAISWKTFSLIISIVHLTSQDDFFSIFDYNITHDSYDWGGELNFIL